MSAYPAECACDEVADAGVGVRLAAGAASLGVFPECDSDDVTQDRLDIRGRIDTARKHGLGAYEILYQLMTGNPWLPPAQPISP
jgi:hypothetical protein